MSVKAQEKSLYTMSFDDEKIDQQMNLLRQEKIKKVDLDEYMENNLYRINQKGTKKDRIYIRCYLAKKEKLAENIPATFQYLFEASELCSKDDYKSQSLINNIFANIYINLGVLQYAIKYLLKIHKSLDNETVRQVFSRKNAYELFYRMAFSYFQLKQYNLAKKNYFQSLNYTNKKRLAGDYNNIGLCYSALGERDSANFYFNKGLEHIDNIIDIGKNDLFYRGLIKGSIGFMEYRLGNEEKGIALVEENFELTKVKTKEKDAVQVGNFLINYYLKNKEISKASDMIKAIENIFDLNFYKKGKLKFLQNKLDFYALKGRVDTLKGLRKQIELAEQELKKELNNQEKNTRELILLINKIEEGKLLAIQNKEIAQFKKSRSNTVYKVALIVILLVGGGMTLLVTYLKKIEVKKKEVELNSLKNKLVKLELKNQDLQNKHLEEEIEVNKQALKQLSLGVEQNTLTHQTIYESLDSIFKKFAIHRSKSVRSFMRNLEYKMKTHETIATSQKHIERINATFFDNLRAEYPKLTENDLRLCALLKLDYNNEDIAAIKNIAVNSVKRSKNRLRKKLDLSQEIDFKTFFS